MASCIHFWNINGDNYGVCKKCGAEHQFPVYQAKFSEQEIRRIERMFGFEAYSPSSDYILAGITLNPSYAMAYKEE